MSHSPRAHPHVHRISCLACFRVAFSRWHTPLAHAQASRASASHVLPRMILVSNVLSYQLPWRMLLGRIHTCVACPDSHAGVAKSSATSAASHAPSVNVPDSHAHVLHAHALNVPALHVAASHGPSLLGHHSKLELKARPSIHILRTEDKTHSPILH